MKHYPLIECGISYDGSNSDEVIRCLKLSLQFVLIFIGPPPNDASLVIYWAWDKLGSVKRPTVAIQMENYSEEIGLYADEVDDALVIFDKSVDWQSVINTA